MAEDDWYGPFERDRLIWWVMLTIGAFILAASFMGYPFTGRQTVRLGEPPTIQWLGHPNWGGVLLGLLPTSVSLLMLWLSRRR